MLWPDHPSISGFFLWNPSWPHPGKFATTLVDAALVEPLVQLKGSTYVLLQEVPIDQALLEAQGYRSP